MCTYIVNKQTFSNDFQMSPFYVYRHQTVTEILESELLLEFSHHHIYFRVEEICFVMGLGMVSSVESQK